MFDVLEMTLENLECKTDAELEVLFSQTVLDTSNPVLEKLYSSFPKMERELKKTGMTVQHLWETYYKEHPDGLKSTQFRHHFKKWSNHVNPVMHINHKVGDKMYVDYAGKKLSITDQITG